MSTPEQPRHIPVLLQDGQDSPVLQILRPGSGDRVLDVTLGLGGHSEAFLQAIGPDGSLVGLDADAENLRSARERLRESKDQMDLRHANFRDVGSLGIEPVDILFADLGLSSPHIDSPDRGFSFRFDAPLDLRFDRSVDATAAAFLAESEEHEITRIFFELGEIKASRRIASVILKRRKNGRHIETTADLRSVAEEAVGWRAPSILPQIFQALRMKVNDERGALTALLEAIPALLRPGGRCGIISYHSLEDRMVKQAFRSWCTPVKDGQTGAIAIEAPFTALTKKPVVPSAEERENNPRSRSAHFRAIRARQ